MSDFLTKLKAQWDSWPAVVHNVVLIGAAVAVAFVAGCIHGKG